MYGKLKISCTLNLLTGLHIGASSGFSAIGSIDSPVVCDVISGRPIIPGSSLKGKLRALLAGIMNVPATAPTTCDKDDARIKRLFGSSEPIHKSRLQFADAFVSNAERFVELGLTEVKFENGIDRFSGRANPRQIERVIRGVEFGVNIIYNIESDADEMMEDIALLVRAMKLLQLDYLGGHGSRGDGRVSLRKFCIDAYECSEGVDAAQIRKAFEEVEQYELLPS